MRPHTGLILSVAAALLAAIAYPPAAEAAATCGGLAATITGTPGPDVIEGTPGIDVIVGGGGDDVIRGKGGDDVICGDEGRDRLFGNGGDDRIWGGPGNDRVRAGRGADTVYGGIGHDRLHGGGDADHMVGGGGHDLMEGGPDADLITGGPGRNVIDGGSGNDVIEGGDDPEVLEGGADDDRIRGNGGSDWIHGGTGDDVLMGGASTPFGVVCPSSGCVALEHDVLRGADGSDVLAGQDGPDLLYGGNSNDTLYGGPGDDVLDGGSDDDLLGGGPGTDEGRGGPGLDACSGVEILRDDCPKPMQDGLADWLGGADARAAATSLFDLIIQQSACGGDAADLDLLDGLAATAPTGVRAPLSSAAVALRRSADACNADPAGWEAELGAALGDLEAMVGFLESVVPRDAVDMGGVTVRATAVVEAVTHLFFEGGVRMRASGMWAGRIHYGKTVDLSRAADVGRTFEVAMVGSSMMQDAVDPGLFTDLDGRSAFNAAMPSFGPELNAPWVDGEVLGLARPAMIVYGVAPRDIRGRSDDAGSCLDSTRRWDVALQRRESAFEPVAALAGSSWQTLLLGDPVSLQVYSVYRSEIDPEGGRILWIQDSPAEIAAAYAAAEGRPLPPICDERVDFLEAELSALVDGGITVVLVGMPLATTRIEVVEGGAAGMAEVVAAYDAVAASAGATWIDLTTVVPDDGFRDITHVNRAGSQVLTAALVERLSSLGL